MGTAVFLAAVLVGFTASKSPQRLAQTTPGPTCYIVSGETSPGVSGWYIGGDGTFLNGSTWRMVSNPAGTYWQIIGGSSVPFTNATTDPTQGTWEPSWYASGTISVMLCPDFSSSSEVSQDADLSIGMTADATVPAQSPWSSTITITNNGPGAVSSFSFKVYPYPSELGLSLLSAPPAGCVPFAGWPGEYDCTVNGDFSAGQTRSFTFTYLSPNTTGQHLHVLRSNILSASSSDRAPANNAATLSLTVTAVVSSSSSSAAQSPACGNGTPEAGEECGETGLNQCTAQQQCINCRCITQCATCTMEYGPKESFHDSHVAQVVAAGLTESTALLAYGETDVVSFPAGGNYAVRGKIVAAAMNGRTVTYGSPVQFTTFNGEKGMAVAALDTAHGVLVYETANGCKVSLVTLNGTTVTVGAGTALPKINTWDNTPECAEASVVALSPTAIVVTAVEPTIGELRTYSATVDPSAGTITFGIPLKVGSTAWNLSGPFNMGKSHDLVKIDNQRFAVSMTNGAAVVEVPWWRHVYAQLFAQTIPPTNAGAVRIGRVNGTTITVGNYITVTSNGAPPRLDIAYSNGKLIAGPAYSAGKWGFKRASVSNLATGSWTDVVLPGLNVTDVANADIETLGDGSFLGATTLGGNRPHLWRIVNNGTVQELSTSFLSSADDDNLAISTFAPAGTSKVFIGYVGGRSGGGVVISGDGAKGLVGELACSCGAGAVCGNGSAETGEVCGEPGLASCPTGKSCQECQCVTVAVSSSSSSSSSSAAGTGVCGNGTCETGERSYIRYVSPLQQLTPEGYSQDAQFGLDVSTIGDFNNDGIPDLAVSSQDKVWIHLLNRNGSTKDRKQVDRGSYSVPLGASPSGDFIALGYLNSVPAFVSTSPMMHVNGQLNAGSISIITLNQNGQVTSASQIAPGVGGFTPSGTVTGFGTAVADVGDLDGNGINDLAVTNGKGRVWILYLQQAGVGVSVKSSTELENFNSMPARFGWSIVSLGDLFNDGRKEIAIGSLYDSTGGDDIGAVYFYYLSSTGDPKSVIPVRNSNLLTELITPIPGQSVKFGSAVAAIGDWDGDGIGDLAVGSQDYASGKGAVWILHLDGTGLAGYPKTVVVKNYEKLAFDGNAYGLSSELTGHIGHSLTAINDLDGDGKKELVVGAPGDPNWSLGGGAAWLFFSGRGTCQRDCDFCGDGVTQSAEQCDNGAQDGACVPVVRGTSCTYCSSTCTIMSLQGWRCGDGIKQGVEQCDGPNNPCAANQTCNSSCQCVATPSASSQSSVHAAAVCGNGLKETGEGCDDGNTVAGDGCSAGCAVESGGQCWDVPAYRFDGQTVEFSTHKTWSVKTAALDEQHALVAYQHIDEDFMAARVATVQNGQITFGPSATFSSSLDVGGVNIIDVQKLDSARAVMTYQMYTNPPNSPRCRAVVAQVSGSNVTFGTPVDLVPMTGDAGCFMPSAAVLSPSLVVFGRQSYTMQGSIQSNIAFRTMVGTVAGLQITLASPVDLTTESKYYLVRSLDATHIMAFGYSSNPDQLWARVGEFAGGAVSWGTEVRLPAIWPASNSYVNSIVPLSPTRVLLMAHTGGLGGITPIEVEVNGKEIVRMHRYPVLAPAGGSMTNAGEALALGAQSFGLVRGACPGSRCQGEFQAVAAPVAGLKKTPQALFQQGDVFVGDAAGDGISFADMGQNGTFIAYTYRPRSGPDIAKELGKATLGVRAGVVSACVPASTCNNGTVEGFEECDTGHACAADYVCSAICRCEQTTDSSASSSASSVTVTSSSQSSFSSILASSQASSTPTCPNGVLDAGETCEIGVCCPGGQTCDRSCHCVAIGSSASSSSIAVVVTCSPSPWAYCSTGYFCPVSCIGDSCMQTNPLNCTTGQHPEYSGSCGNTLCSGQCGRCVAGSSSSIAIQISSSSAYSSAASIACGNSRLEGSEQCEIGVPCVNGKVCTNCACTVIGFCGDDIVDPLRSEECEQNGDCPAGSVCSLQCQCEATQGECGNAVLEGSEQCESGHSCPAGQICNNCLCSAPPRCGNSALEYLEECEIDVLCPNNETCVNCICRAPGVCGNGVLETNEQCENTAQCLTGQTCDRGTCRCQGEAHDYCGDAVLAEGEECEMNAPCTEEGKNCNLTTCLCVRQPVILTCGDAMLDPGEDCDIGVPCPGEQFCSFANCHCTGSVSRCGDARLEATERCEIGVPCAQPGEACDITTCQCAPPDLSGSCGNGLMTAGEECEVGIPCPFGWSCDFPRCRCLDQPVCGDGVLDPGELCEINSACTGDQQVCDFSRCRCTGRIYECGNGARDPGEECDDGNTLNDDGCSKKCMRETLYSFVGSSSQCGNGLVEGSEDCDDGNVFSGDGCSAFCFREENFFSTGTLPTAASSESAIAHFAPAGVVSSASGMASSAARSAQQLQFPSSAQTSARSGASPLAAVTIPFPQPFVVNAVAQPSGGQMLPYTYGMPQPPIARTGPEAVALVSAGTAFGWAWIRRRRKR